MVMGSKTRALCAAVLYARSETNEKDGASKNGSRVSIQPRKFMYHKFVILIANKDGFVMADDMMLSNILKRS